jgi:hypothetical protein
VEYGRWLGYIVNVFMPIVDSENGDLRSLPFEGGIMSQPYMTMSLIRHIQGKFKEEIAKKHKKMMAKTGGQKSPRRPVRRRR